MPHVPDLSGSALDDRYELHALIGEGAFGRVYAGRDRRLERPVAVKVIKPWWAEDPEWVTDFERETRLLARISDPGIVQIYDVGHAPEGRYYVSELVSGENLAQRLSRGPIAPWQAAGIAAQLCRALAGAHAQRIVHRDVKPPNILLSSSGQVKVGDFGVAGLAEGSSGGGSQTIVGTPSYMAPEQSRGRPISPATDVYSAGVVLYEMVAGSRPFRADSAVELALCHLQDSPPPLPTSVPEPLRQIIARALAKDPSQRYADGGEMADALVDASRRAGERARERAGRSASRAAPRPTRRATGRGAAERRSAERGATERRATDRAATERRATERIAGTAVMATAGTASAGTATTGVATLTPPAPPPERPRRAAATTPPRRPTPPAPANGPDGTRPAPLVSRRSEHNPPARRRAIAALLGAFALVGAMVGAAVVLGASGSGASKRHVVPKVEVPNVTGMSTATAEARLKRSHLHARVVTVPWPGHAAGTVRSQSPVARRVKRRSTVTLSVAEVPTWKTVGQFSSTISPVYLIQGSKFRLVYSVQNEKSCTLWVFCSRSSVTVTDTASGSQVDQFDLSDGSGERQVFATGRGSYQVKVDPASGDARWSFAVQDWY
jgi:eukaryotic-like serine/threonine-protein kinase